ncbi:LOW QUALITY PROTEIN: hypothetical protein ACHAWF_016749 [Thalassiosira exigua]
MLCILSSPPFPSLLVRVPTFGDVLLFLIVSDLCPPLPSTCILAGLRSAPPPRLFLPPRDRRLLRLPLCGLRERHLNDLLLQEELLETGVGLDQIHLLPLEGLAVVCQLPHGREHPLLELDGVPHPQHGPRLVLVRDDALEFGRPHLQVAALGTVDPQHGPGRPRTGVHLRQRLALPLDPEGLAALLSSRDAVLDVEGVDGPPQDGAEARRGEGREAARGEGNAVDEGADAADELREVERRDRRAASFLAAASVLVLSARDGLVDVIRGDAEVAVPLPVRLGPRQEPRPGVVVRHGVEREPRVRQVLEPDRIASHPVPLVRVLLRPAPYSQFGLGPVRLAFPLLVDGAEEVPVRVPDEEGILEVVPRVDLEPVQHAAPLVFLRKAIPADSRAAQRWGGGRVSFCFLIQRDNSRASSRYSAATCSGFPSSINSSNSSSDGGGPPYRFAKPLTRASTPLKSSSSPSRSAPLPIPAAPSSSSYTRCVRSRNSAPAFSSRSLDSRSRLCSRPSSPSTFLSHFSRFFRSSSYVARAARWASYAAAIRAVGSCAGRAYSGSTKESTRAAQSRASSPPPPARREEEGRARSTASGTR